MANRGGSRHEEEPEVTWTAVPLLSSPSQKHAYLLVLAGPEFGAIFPLASGRALVLGRREDADIQIRDDGVSRRHASIQVEGQGAVVRDLGSANGTYYMGELLHGRVVCLKEGDRFQIGDTEFVFHDKPRS